MANRTQTIKSVVLGDASDFKSSMNEVADSAEKATKDSSGAFDKFATFVKGAATVAASAAAGIGAALLKGVTDAYDAEAANDKLAASLGLPPERAAELGAAAGAVYRDAYGESLGEVNDVIARLFKDGLVPEDATNDAIEGMTKRVLDTATAFDQDLGAVTRGVSNLMRNGLAPDAEAAFDIVTRGFQQGADKAEDFLDTLNEYGTQFRKLGIDGADATGLITQGLAAGARDGDKVADALKEFSIRAIDGSELTKQAFTDLGVDANLMAQQIAAGGPAARAGLDQILDGLRGVQDPIKRSQIAVGLFGTQAEDLGDALYALDLDTAAKGLGNIAGAADRMGNTLNDNPAAKIEAFKRTVLGGLQDFAGRHVIPALERVGAFVQQRLVPVLQQAAAWVQANVIPALQDFATKIRENVIPALQDAGAWIMDNIVPAIQAFAGWVRDDAVPAVQGFVGWLVEHLTPAALKLQEQILAVQPHLQEMGRRIREDVLPPVQDMVQRFRDDVVPVLKQVAEWIFDNVVPAFLDLQAKLTEYVLPVIEKLISFLGSVIEVQVKAYDAIKEFGKGVAEFVGDAKTKFDELIGFVQGLPGRISSAASGMWDGIKGAFRSAINAVIGMWNGLNFPGISVAGVQVAPAFGTPDITYLAAGGLVKGGRGGTLAMIGEGRHDELVVPLNRVGGAAMRSVNVTINAAPGTNVRDLGYEVQRILNEYSRAV